MQFHENNEKKFFEKKNKNMVLPNNSTPIFCAGFYNCVHNFDYLLSFGANPFIKNDNDIDAIDIALMNGDIEMLKYITSKNSFINSNGKYLFSLMKNEHAVHVFNKNIFNLGFHNINIVNSYQQNLLMISFCQIITKC